MPIWHQSPKLTPRYFLETPRLFGYPPISYKIYITYRIVKTIIEINTPISANTL